MLVFSFMWRIFEKSFNSFDSEGSGWAYTKWFDWVNEQQKEFGKEVLIAPNWMMTVHLYHGIWPIVGAKIVWLWLS